jgi:hypothetical protein
VTGVLSYTANTVSFLFSQTLFASTPATHCHTCALSLWEHSLFSLMLTPSRHHLPDSLDGCNPYHAYLSIRARPYRTQLLCLCPDNPSGCMGMGRCGGCIGCGRYNVCKVLWMTGFGKGQRKGSRCKCDGCIRHGGLGTHDGHASLNSTLISNTVLNVAKSNCCYFSVKGYLMYLKIENYIS